VLSAAIGLFAIALGLSAMARGEQGWVNYHHEFIWAVVVIMSGGIVFLVAIIPSSFVTRLIGFDKKKKGQTSAPPRPRG
jgi:hypothetical protein